MWSGLGSTGGGEAGSWAIIEEAVRVIGHGAQEGGSEASAWRIPWSFQDAGHLVDENAERALACWPRLRRNGPSNTLGVVIPWDERERDAIFQYKKLFARCFPQRLKQRRRMLMALGRSDLHGYLPGRTHMPEGPSFMWPTAFSSRLPNSQLFPSPLTTSLFETLRPSPTR